MGYETAVAIIGVGVLWFFGMMSMSTNDKHPILKLIYILLGLSTMVGLIGLGINIANEFGASQPVLRMLSNMLWIASTVGMLVGAYYLYYIVLWVYAKILSVIGERKAKKFGGEFKS